MMIMVLAAAAYFFLFLPQNMLLVLIRSASVGCF